MAKKNYDNPSHLTTDSMFNMIDQSVHATALLDYNNKVLKVNELFRGLFGWSKQDLDQNIQSLIPSNINTENHQQQLHIINDLIRLDKEGELLDFRIIVSPILNAQGDIISNVFTVIDITKEKQQEVALKEKESQLESFYANMPDPTLTKIELKENLLESERQLRTIINNMSDLICFKDGKGRWLEANDFGMNLFQFEDSFKGKRNSDLYAYDDFFRNVIKNCDETDIQAWEAKTSVRYEQIIPQPNLPDKVFDMIKIPLFQVDGKRKSIIIIGRDITEKNKAEAIFRNSEKMKALGQLASGTAHEIRNPLTSIRGFLTLFKEGHIKEDHIDIILKELSQIEKLSDQFITLAKSETFFTLNNPTLIIEQAISQLAPIASENNISIIEDFHSKLPLLKSDKDRLTLVVVNILRNAIEASSPGNEVSVHIKHTETYLIISIVDEGHGIESDRIKRLGEPHYSNSEKGIGLGLTISYKIVEAHQGEIQITSNLNQGTTVKVLIPYQL